MNQSWTLCWMFTAKSCRKAPQHSLSPPCPCSSSTTTSTTTLITRPPSLAGIFHLPREVIQLEAEEITTGAYAVLLAPIQEACVSYLHLPMMTAPQIQHLHPIPHQRPRSPRHPCCLPIALTQPWSPPMGLPKEHTSLTCHPHLPQQGVSPSGCPPWCTPPIPDALLTLSQMI